MAELPVTPSCTVILCTYQGAAYLPEFLAGVLAQTRLPDRVLVQDDGSTDGTLELLRDFAAQAPFPVEIRQTPSNLGSTANFADALAYAAATWPEEVLILADQDDLWLAEKLAQTLAAFADPTVGAVFSNALLVDERGRPYAWDLWQSVGFQAGEPEALFPLLLQKNVVTGATFACRAALLPPLLPIPEVWVHDAWLALLLAATSRVQALPQHLIRYRQHRHQQHGAPRWRLRDRLWHACCQRDRRGHLQHWLAAELTRIDSALARLRQLGGSTDCQRQLAGRRHHLANRLALHEKHGWARLALVWQEWQRGNYQRYANGWPALLKDLW